MKKCPLCRQEPFWLAANHTTIARKFVHHIYCACDHFAQIIGERIPVSLTDSPAVEARSNARADQLFDEMTRGYSEAAKNKLRDSLYPPHTGEPWEHHDWVKLTRVRLANAREFFDAPQVLTTKPARNDDCPFD